MNDVQIFSGSLRLIESFGRSYNVDCSVAHEFYHLNDGLYLTSPEQISQAISPAIRISQPDAELLAGSASSLHASPSLALTSADLSLAPASGLRQGKSLPASPLTSEVQTPGVTPAVVSADPSVTYNDVQGAQSIYYDDVADPEPVSVISAASVASVYNDAVADPEPAGYYTGAAPAPGLTNGYDDAVADPEPQAYYDAIASDPEPYGYPGPFSYDASDPEPAPAAPVLASGVAYDGASNSVDFYDALADPEPAGYYDPGYPGGDPEPGADPEYYQY